MLQLKFECADLYSGVNKKILSFIITDIIIHDSARVESKNASKLSKSRQVVSIMYIHT